MADPVITSKQALAALCGDEGPLDVDWSGDDADATASVTVRPLIGEGSETV